MITIFILRLGLGMQGKQWLWLGFNEAGEGQAGCEPSAAHVPYRLVCQGADCPDELTIWSSSTCCVLNLGGVSQFLSNLWM